MISIRFLILDGNRFREFSGSFDPSLTVLDALEALRTGQARRSDHPDHAGGRPPVPAYRHSCHHGSCGTCGAIINGLEGLMCLTRLGDLALPRSRVPGGPKTEPERTADGTLMVRLEPLRRGSVVAGIAARPIQALAGIPENVPYLMPLEADSAEDKAEGKGERKADLPEDPTRPLRGAMTITKPETAQVPNLRVRFEACIECGLCTSSCPVTVPFIGPAALAALNRQRQKHPGTAQAMLTLAGAQDGVAACQRHLACSRVCPQGVYPGKHIQLLKNALRGGT